ncbi:MAG: IMP dehydrogenase [candidate division KSB1 bacterium]|nr:IMP dehydrogenase [candidate division KSB1 bacterium]MDZ7317659.1 IMP dehydrogenase [candidate division KSB1 bacterium]
MDDHKIVGEGITFDDILLLPAKSNVLPKSADTRTRLTRQIALNIPLVSAAMDTVTEADLAIALAREGGIGIIHKNMSIEAQAAEVDKVKRSESGMILKPISMSPEHLIGDAIEVMNKFHISGIPIVEDDKLVGILTNRDLRFETNLRLKIKDVMTKDNLITAPVGTTLEQAEQILQKHRIEKLPVVDDQRRLKGLITVKDIQKKRKYPLAAKDIHGRLRVGAAVGIGPEGEARARALIEAGVDVIVIDTAHGHSLGVITAVKRMKQVFSEIEIIAGNIGTAAAAEDLIQAGADAVKVGIGPSGICTTRVVTGVGVPQITAIMECARVCQKYDIPLIADGGIKLSGDIAKAIAAGADTVMIGNLFAGTQESPGEIIFLEGRSYKVYRGMGSIEAMKRGSSDRYFQDSADATKLVPEGIEGRVPYRGPLSDTIFQMIGGLKSAMGYCGVATLAELKAKARFIKVSQATVRENHPHSVIITKEAPNYKLLSH